MKICIKQYTQYPELYVARIILTKLGGNGYEQ